MGGDVGVGVDDDGVDMGLVIMWSLWGLSLMSMLVMLLLTGGM